jgi:hypothetical protein
MRGRLQKGDKNEVGNTNFVSELLESFYVAIVGRLLSLFAKERIQSDLAVFL